MRVTIPEIDEYQQKLVWSSIINKANYEKSIEILFQFFRYYVPDTLIVRRYVPGLKPPDIR